MHSSTSSSDNPYRLAVRMGAFGVLFIAITQLFRLFGLGYPAIPVPIRDGDRVYLATDNANYDHLEYMFGGGALKHAAAADILFLGNSRLMMGVNFTEVMRALDGTGLQPHWLGFAQGEPHDLPERIVQENDLAPKLVVINADRGFFNPGMSLYTQSLYKQGKEAATEYYDQRKADNRFWRTWQAYVPIPQINRWHWRLEHRRMPLIYRSEKYGDWIYSAPDIMIRDRQPFGKPQHALPENFETQLAEARQFVNMLRDRGSEVVFITVPNPEGGENVALRIGEELGIEVITVPWEGYATFDSSHLTVDGARKFTKEMMSQLRGTQAWQRAFDEGQ